MKKMDYLKIHAPRLLGLIIMAFFVLHFSIRENDFITNLIPLKCPLNFWLSIKCPLCGLGHAILEANKHHFSLSLKHHILGVFVYGYLVLLSAGLILVPQKIIALHLALIYKIKSKLNKLLFF